MTNIQKLKIVMLIEITIAITVVVAVVVTVMVANITIAMDMIIGINVNTNMKIKKILHQITKIITLKMTHIMINTMMTLRKKKMITILEIIIIIIKMKVKYWMKNLFYIRYITVLLKVFAI